METFLTLATKLVRCAHERTVTSDASTKRHVRELEGCVGCGARRFVSSEHAGEWTRPRDVHALVDAWPELEKTLRALIACGGPLPALVEWPTVTTDSFGVQFRDSRLLVDGFFVDAHESTLVVDRMQEEPASLLRVALVDRDTGIEHRVLFDAFDASAAPLAVDPWLGSTVGNAVASVYGRALAKFDEQIVLATTFGNPHVGASLDDVVRELVAHGVHAAPEAVADRLAFLAYLGRLEKVQYPQSPLPTTDFWRVPSMKRDA